MEIGISLACFYPEHPEDVVDRVCDMGFKTAELFLNTFSELDASYIKSLADLCNKRDLTIYSIHPFTSALENYMFFSPYDRRIKDSVYLYQKYCDVAKAFDAKVINFHGDRGLGLQNFDEYCECLAPLTELSEKNNVVISHENVFFNSINHPEFVRKLREKLGDSVKFTFDIKQANKGGANPYELCEAMSSDVVNFHINDYDEENICLLPGDGIVEHKKLIKTLLRNNYSGPAIIEVYRSNFSDIDDILRSKLYLEKIIKALEL